MFISDSELDIMNKYYLEGIIVGMTIDSIMSISFDYEYKTTNGEIKTAIKIDCPDEESFVNLRNRLDEKTTLVFYEIDPSTILIPYIW